MTDLSGIGVHSDSDIVFWNFYFPTVSVAWATPVLFPALVTVTFRQICSSCSGCARPRQELTAGGRYWALRWSHHLFSSNGNTQCFHQPPKDRCSLQIFSSTLSSFWSVFERIIAWVNLYVVSNFCLVGGEKAHLLRFWQKFPLVLI